MNKPVKEAVGHGVQKVRETRPPGTVHEGELAEICVNCGDCVEVCPAGAIHLDREGYPMLTEGIDCIMCGLCADVCTHGAIRLTRRTRRGLEQVLRAERLTGYTP